MPPPPKQWGISNSLPCVGALDQSGFHPSQPTGGGRRVVMNTRRTKVHRRAIQSELVTERWSHSRTRVLITSAEGSLPMKHRRAAVPLSLARRQGENTSPLLSTDRRSDFYQTDAKRPSEGRTYLFMLPAPSSAAPPLLMTMKPTERHNAHDALGSRLWRPRRGLL